MKKINPNDYMGQTFGEWTIIAIAEPIVYRYKYEHIHHRVICRCSCGTEKINGLLPILRRKTSSCGCKLSEFVSIGKTKHGHAKNKTTEYQSWKKMNRRCFTPSDKNYHQYGGRGITVCDRWKNSFENFLEDMGLKPSKDYSIERIDVNGSYCPENCTWATTKQQSRNRRNNKLITYNGVTKCLVDWAEQYKIKPSLLRARLFVQRWDFERAVTTTPFLFTN